MVKLLLEEGANTEVTNSAGLTALMLAACQGYTDVAKVLIESGADLTVATQDGYTALMLAVVNMHTDVAKMLIDHGVNINAKDRLGRTALDYAKTTGASVICEYIEKALQMHNTKEADPMDVVKERVKSVIFPQPMKW